MKKLFLFFLLTTNLIFAQTEQINPQQLEPKTNLEKFSSKTGTMYIREFSNGVEVDGNLGTTMKVQSLVIYEPGKEAQKEKGIILQVSGYKKEAQVFLDLDELGSWLKAIDYILEQEPVLKTRQKYFEVNYSTRGDMKFGVYKDGNELKVYVKAVKYPYPDYYADFEELVKMKKVVGGFYKELSELK